jgi:hypothetical protein
MVFLFIYMQKKRCFMHESIPGVTIPPPGTPPGICLIDSSRGSGICLSYTCTGAGYWRTPGIWQMVAQNPTHKF